MKVLLLAAVWLTVAPLYGAVSQYVGGPQQLPDGAVVVRINERGHLERSIDSAITWSPVVGLPVRVLPAYRADEPVPVTAAATQPPGADRPSERMAIALSPGVKRVGRLVALDGAPTLVATGTRLHVSRDGLESWDEIDLSAVINQSTYITALAIDHADAAHWVVGTSYNGMYRTRDAGSTWRELTADRSRWPNFLGAGFFEEIAGLWFTTDGSVVVQSGFGQGFLVVHAQDGGEPLAGTAASSRGAAVRAADAPLRVERLLPAADGSVSFAAFARVVGETASIGAPVIQALTVRPADDARARRLTAAADRTGIYLAAHNAAPSRLPAYFALMERFGYDSIVVDVKDDLGQIMYATSLPAPRAAGAVVPVLDLPRFVAAAHARGIYVIARIVVFKDHRLAAYDGYRYSLWDSRHNRPWAVYRTVTDAETGERRTIAVERWVDPYLPEVWDYNVAIAEEVVALGVDEVQFDYIRFPSDGIVADVVSRYAVAGADRVQALEGFLAEARRRLDVPISIDLFGFNAWSRMRYLGQDMVRLSDYVDVVSPMFYPSHFVRTFLPQFSYMDRSFVIYDLGTRRSRVLAGDDVLIRPYLQAFLIGAELEFERPVFERYLQLQKDASIIGGASGFTLWNASGRYYMLPAGQ